MKLEKMLIKSEIKKEGRKMYKELRVRKKKFYGKKRLWKLEEMERIRKKE